MPHGGSYPDAFGASQNGRADDLNIVALDAARARRHELAVADFAAALFDETLDNETCQQLLADALVRMDRDHVRRLTETVSELEMWAQVDDILAGA